MLWLALSVAHAEGVELKLLETIDWDIVGECMPGRSSDDCLFRCLSLGNCSVKVKPWTEEEDRLLS